MKRILILLAVVLSIASAHAAEPLRVFIRGGKKSYGPQAHEHARFLEKWQPLLTERGMKVDGALEFPTEAQLEQTDVLVMYAQDGSEGTHRRPHARPRCTGARISPHTRRCCRTPSSGLRESSRAVRSKTTRQ